jgi:hypothetical protein
LRRVDAADRVETPGLVRLVIARVVGNGRRAQRDPEAGAACARGAEPGPRDLLEVVKQAVAYRWHVVSGRIVHATQVERRVQELEWDATSEKVGQCRRFVRLRAAGAATPVLRQRHRPQRLRTRGPRARRPRAQRAATHNDTGTISCGCAGPPSPRTAPASTDAEPTIMEDPTVMSCWDTPAMGSWFRRRRFTEKLPRTHERPGPESGAVACRPMQVASRRTVAPGDECWDRGPCHEPTGAYRHRSPVSGGAPSKFPHPWRRRNPPAV